MPRSRAPSPPKFLFQATPPQVVQRAKMLSPMKTRGASLWVATFLASAAVSAIQEGLAVPLAAGGGAPSHGGVPEGPVSLYRAVDGSGWVVIASGAAVQATGVGTVVDVAIVAMTRGGFADGAGATPMAPPASKAAATTARWALM
jgi:hypothetical protein